MKGTAFASLKACRTFLVAWAVLGTSGCAMIGPQAPIELPALFTDLGEDITRFNKMGEAARAPAAQPSHVRDFRKAGASLSDTVCDGWLDALHRTDREVAYAKDIMNIVANAFLGIGGVNRINPVDIGRANIVLGAANASIDTFRAEFIQGAIPKIKTKIKEARTLALQALEALDPTEYDKARRALSEYHGTCSSIAIKNLVETSLQAVRYARPDPKADEAYKDTQEAVAARVVYSIVFGRTGAFDPEQLFRFWVVWMSGLESGSTLHKAYSQDRLVALALASAPANANPPPQPYVSLVSELGAIAQRMGYQARLTDRLNSVETAAREVKDAADAANKALADFSDHFNKNRQAMTSFTIPSATDSKQLRRDYDKLPSSDAIAQKLASDHVARTAALEAATERLTRALERPAVTQPSLPIAIQPELVRIR